MSLILEALKKSEDKRRLGAAPDLATPFSAPRRRSWVWPLAALIVIAGVVAWALRPSSPPPARTVAAVPAKSKAPAAQATPTPGQKSGAPLRSVTGNNDLVQAPPPVNLPKTETHPANDAPAGQFVFGQPNQSAGQNAPTGPTAEDRRGARAAGRERRAGQAGRNAAAATPMPVPGAVAPAPPRANAAAAPSVAAPKTNVAASTAAPVAVAPKTVAPTATPAAPVSQQPSAPLPSSIAPPAASAVSRAPKTSSTVGLQPAASAQPPATAPSGAAGSAQPYAELPFSVRKSLPELKVSMHVYAANPTQRFVVLNDSRLTEGEKTSDDIFVREIRPDGVVLEFQSQRFFYPRDGL